MRAPICLFQDASAPRIKTFARCVRIADWIALECDSARRAELAGTRARPTARALNPLLNAFVQITPAPEAPRQGGVLDGLTIAAKDMFQSPSHRPGCGFAGGCGPDIDGNSDVLARIEAAGADLIGITAMTELAYEPSGFNDGLGRVKNPWNPDFISGGSSSGSAVAVASGIVTAALGSDTGGSLRIPAFACGVTAWKPTHDWWLIVNALARCSLAPTLDSIGLLARSANDMMQLLPIMGDFPVFGKITRAAVLADVAAKPRDPAIPPAPLADARLRCWPASAGTTDRKPLGTPGDRGSIDVHCMSSSCSG